MSLSSQPTSHVVDETFGNELKVFWQEAFERLTHLLDDWASRQQTSLQEALDKITQAKTAVARGPCRSFDEPVASAVSFQSDELVTPPPTPMAQMYRQRRQTPMLEVLPGRVASVVENLKSLRSAYIASGNPPNGLLARAIKSRTSALVGVVAILANIVCIALETENDVALASEGKFPSTDEFFFANLAFICYYVMELVGRVYVQRIHFLLGAESKWNLFDFVLLCVAIQDLWLSQQAKMALLRVTKVLKLSRALKLIKLVEVLKSLRLILNGVWSSVRSMFWAFFLIVLTTFSFGLWFTQACTVYFMYDPNRDSEVDTLFLKYFGSVFNSMKSLYEASFGGDDWAPMVSVLGAAGRGYQILFFTYIAFFSLVVLNTLTSLFVEAAMEFAERDADDMVKHRLDAARHCAKLLHVLFDKIDVDGNGRISFDEVRGALNEVEMVALMSSLQIDVNNVELFIDELRVQGEVDIDVHDFITKCSRLRGSARSVDLIAFQSTQTRAMEKLSKAVSSLSAEVTRLGKAQGINAFWTHTL